MTKSQKNILNLLLGSSRRKHLKYNYANFTLIENFKYFIKKFILNSVPDSNKTSYLLPNIKKKIIPTEFIRLDPWEIEYLFSVAQFSKKGIVEIGRFNGGSAILFGSANKLVPIWSIDIAPQNDKKLIQIFKDLDIKNVNLIIGDSQVTIYEDVKSYDFLFIDGDHSYQSCYNDLNNWWNKLSVGGHLILHDCYLFCEVQKAVIDFLSDKKFEIIISAYRGSKHWHNKKSGSLCHFIKK
jgi:predicted O-methyltransferase YrrM